MPLATNDISFANIQLEFGGTNPIELDEYYAGGPFVPAGAEGVNGPVPTEGAISCLDLAGVEFVQMYVRGIASQSGFDLDGLVGAIRNDGTIDLRFTLRESSTISFPGILGGYVRIGQLDWDTKGNLIGQGAVQPLSNTNTDIRLRSAHTDIETGNVVSFTGSIVNTAFTPSEGILFGGSPSAALFHNTQGLREGYSCRGPSGVLYIACETNAGGIGNQGIMLVKYGNSGVEWAKKIQTGGGNTFKTKSIHYVEAKNEIVLVVEGLNMNPSGNFRNNGKGHYVWKFNTSGSIVDAKMLFIGTSDLDHSLYITASDSLGHLYGSGNEVFGPPMPENLVGVSRSSSTNIYFRANNSSSIMSFTGNEAPGSVDPNWHARQQPYNVLDSAQLSAHQSFDFRRQNNGVFLITDPGITGGNGEFVGFSSLINLNQNYRRIQVVGMGCNEPPFTFPLTKAGLYAWTLRNTDATAHELYLDNTSSVFQKRNSKRTIVMAATTKVVSLQNVPDKLILSVTPYFSPYRQDVERSPLGTSQENFTQPPFPSDLNFGRMQWSPSNEWIERNNILSQQTPWSYTIENVLPSQFNVQSGAIITASSFAVENIFPTNPL